MAIQNGHMKMKLLKNKTVLTAMALSFGAMGFSRAQVVVSPPNYTVTTPASQFAFDLNGASSSAPPQSGTHDSVDFSLNAGATYLFTMNTASFHPVDICTNPSTSALYSGASQQAVSSGTIKLTIPATNYPPTLYYICNIHSFYGIITVNPPQPPPAASIASAAVSSNIIVTFSGGTNTIQLVPQFSSNLVSGIWQPVPAYTNTFSGTGTGNTTSFNRLDAICGPNVFLRISQSPN
jgi:hypothetical protein